MDEYERIEWRKAVKEVMRSERHKKREKDRTMLKRLKILSSRAYTLSNPQKRQEMRDTAYTMPLTFFGLQKKKIIKKYF